MNKRTKVVIGTIVAIIVIMIGYLTVQDSNESMLSNSIKIGAILPLTGVMAEYGNDELNAIKLYIEDNKLESRFELIAPHLQIKAIFTQL